MEAKQYGENPTDEGMVAGVPFSVCRLCVGQWWRDCDFEGVFVQQDKRVSGRLTSPRRGG